MYGPFGGAARGIIRGASCGKSAVLMAQRKAQRDRGSSETLPSGALRVNVYAGIDPDEAAALPP